jgi:hypothetical protein
MEIFEYAISRHPADAFKELVYFCAQDGQCSLEHVPSKQLNVLQNILNERGRDGWELVQVTFGKDGVLVFWKKWIKEREF